MKFSTVLAATAVTAGSVLGVPMAQANDEVAPTLTSLGQAAQLVNGSAVQTWTVSGLKPSGDVIPWHVNGTLWEATATNEAVQGSIQPVVSDFNARARNGDTYRVLFLAATPQGVNPAVLPPGAKTSGKVYFDVTGEQPDSVVYNSGGHDLAVWLTPPPAPVPSGTSAAPFGGSRPGVADAAPSAAVPPAPAAPPGVVPAAGPVPVGTPPPTGASGTPLPGSTGTPLPEGSSGTPLPGTSTSPTGTARDVPAGTAGTSMPSDPAAPAATPAPATASSQPTGSAVQLAPAGSSPASGTTKAPVTTTVPAPAP
ncbi:hypothetical protein MMAD_55920 (plasmid) [Mycolicibacterium madagascariense]|uniref:MPT63-like domain-containing protein n=1 Tax=Mycolicibacterium madagascariense TaxID=212765 RepID=A0A7I7XPX3_9MYCO|nr:MPT63 family protein [Mycolicibacterium madagascariense]BBZ31297.1 hypothetical protein MMAD_55920 [Mycolicibacterium madagascariense]